MCVLHTCGLESLTELEYMFPEWQSFSVWVSIFKERSQEERGRKRRPLRGRSATHPQPAPTEPSRAQTRTSVGSLNGWARAGEALRPCCCVGGSTSCLGVLKTAQVSTLSGFSAGKQRVFLVPCLSKPGRQPCKQEYCSGLPFPFPGHLPCQASRKISNGRHGTFLKAKK